MNRRELLIAAGSAWLLGCERDRHPARQSADVVMGGGRFQAGPQAPVEFVLATVDLGLGQRQMTKLNFFPHGVQRHPIQADRAALFEKIGPGACEFDLRTGQVTRPIVGAADRWFYGHGTYSADGELLLCTEAYRDGEDGIIGVRDSADLKFLGAFPSYGRAPHECQLIDGGATLVVTNGGGPLGGEAPSLAFIDIASQRLLERYTPSNERLNTGHFAVGSDGQIVVVSAPRPGLEIDDLGGISVLRAASDLRSLRQPANWVGQMRGEALSVAVHRPSGRFAVTHPDANGVSIWSADGEQGLRWLTLDRPRGVTLNDAQNAFIISCGARAELITVPVDTLQPAREPAFVESYITGSHLYRGSAAA